MFIPDTSRSWLARVHHDLVKRLLWFARDCRDAGRPPSDGELVATLYDERGQPVDATTLWDSLRETAPSTVDLEDFGVAVRACVEAALRDDLEGVLCLESAFEHLKAAMASSLNQPGSAEPPPRKAR